MIDRDELPADPDWSDVPEDLQLLAGLNDGRVTVLDSDGVGPCVLVLAPPLFAHARRMSEGTDAA